MMHNRQFNDDLVYIYDKVAPSRQLSGANVLVTGAGGFVGFYLSSVLAKFKSQLNIDRLALVDLRDLSQHAPYNSFGGGVELVQHDMSDTTNNPLDGADFDVIINLASFASPVAYRANPAGTLKGSVSSVWQLLERFAATAGADKYFQIYSSSEIYGDPTPDQIPTAEDYRGNVSCIGPRACYDESKRFIETLGYVFASQSSLNISVVRPFNNYGPGMKLNDGRLPADVMNAMVRQSPMDIYSDGTPTRSFCYIADAIAGYLTALNQTGFSVYNIGNDMEELSVRQFIERAAGVYEQETGKTFDVQFTRSSDANYLTDNPNRRFPNLEKARAELGYTPEIDVDDGLTRWYRFETDQT